MRLITSKTLKEVSLFCFPSVVGLEKISQKLENIEADSLFSALLQVFRLRQIKSEKEAREAEGLLEYLERAFESNPPLEIRHYKEVLLLLISDFDEKHYIPTAKDIKPYVFLKLLLEENNLNQKDLVPNCFKSESQVSEFINQRKGRTQLSYPQAVALGRFFSVEPSNFLS